MKKWFLKGIAVIAAICGVLAFAGAKRAEAATISADTSWYVGHESDTEYTLTTPAQLFGLAELSLTTDFAGKTIHLTENGTYVLNDDYLTAWANWKTGTEAENAFPGIGGIYTNAATRFQGVIDGHNATIYGMYRKNDARSTGFVNSLTGKGQVKNLNFDYCYVASTAASPGDVGTVAGTVNSTTNPDYQWNAADKNANKFAIDHVTAGSHCYVTGTTTTHIGGIVGQIWAAGIKDAVFNGEVEKTGTGIGAAGIAGGTTSNSVWICDCVNNGTVKSNGYGIGGIFGVWDYATKAGTVKISGCKNTGAVSGFGTSSYSVGGIFGCTTNDKGFNVQILDCENSGTISCTRPNEAYVGGIIGRFRPSKNDSGVYGSLLIQNCKSTGDVTGHTYISGILGRGEYGAVSADNCYVSGTITSTGNAAAFTGALLGHSTGNVTFTNAYSNATVKGSRTTGAPCIGGLVGTFAGDKLVMEQCAFAGELKIDTGAQYNQAGLILAQINGSGSTKSVTFKNCFAVHRNIEANYGAGNRSYGTVGQNVSNHDIIGWPVVLAETDMQGEGLYPYIQLDSNWKYVENDIPQLVKFSDAQAITPTYDGIKADYSWFQYFENHTQVKTFTINTPEQYLAFCGISRAWPSTNQQQWDGITFELGADLTLNEGDASTWGETAPKNKYVPIGTDIYVGGGKAAMRFSFNGNGHTISGLYIKTTGLAGMISQKVGGTVSNFTLTNSYIENNSQRAAVVITAIAGSGTVDSVTVTDSVYLKNSATGNGWVGGISGQAWGATISNCNVAAKITAKGQAIGGIVGLDNAGALTLNNCKFTGSIYTENHSVGGLVGRIEGSAGAISFTECEVSGDITGGISANGTNAARIGSLIGYATGSTTLTIARCAAHATVTGIGLDIGGIAGLLETTGNVTISDTLFDGKVYASRPYDNGGLCTGGIVGRPMNHTLRLTNVIMAGEIHAANKTNTGIMIGSVQAAAGKTTTIIFKNPVVVQSSKNENITGDNQNRLYAQLYAGSGTIETLQITGGAILTSAAELGANAYKVLSFLDFEDTWVAIPEGAPQLKALYTGTPADVTGMEQCDYLFGFGDETDFAAGEEFEIATVEQLLALAYASQFNSFEGKRFVLADNLDLTDVIWRPIGNAQFPFKGIFEGCDCTISNITLNPDYNQAALFASLEGTVNSADYEMSLFLDNIHIEVTDKNYTAILAGIANNAQINRVVVTNSSVTVNGNKSYYAGGLVALANSGETNFYHCAVDMDLAFTAKGEEENQTAPRGAHYVGNVASTAKVAIDNCYAGGNATCAMETAGNNIGGFCGLVTGRMDITNSLSTVNIVAADPRLAGALIGQVQPNAVLTLDGVYGNTTGISKLYVNNGGAVIGVGSGTDYANYLGATARAYTQKLDYDVDCLWALREDATPYLALYVDEPLVADFYTVLAYSVLKNNGSQGIAPLMGAGKVAQNSNFTLTATEVSGLEFIGWYKTEDAGATWSEITGGAVSGKNYDGVATEDEMAFVALYRQKAYTVELNLCIPENETYSYKVGEKEAVTAIGTQNISVAVGDEVTLKFIGKDYRLNCWISGSGKTLSKNNTYTFTALVGTAVEAVLSGSTETAVTFLNPTGQIQAIKYVTASSVDTELAEMPAGPSKIGQTFVDWDKDLTQIKAEIEGGAKLVEVKPVMEDGAAEYSLSLIPVKVTTADVTAMLNSKNWITVGSEQTAVATSNLSRIAQITAAATFEGASFAGFARQNGDGMVFVSHNRTTFYRALANETLYAIYTTSAFAPEYAGTVAITNANGKVENEKFNAQITMSYNAPQGATVVSQGILFLNTNHLTAASLEDSKTVASAELNLDGIARRYESDVKNTAGATTLNIKNMAADANVYARAFLVYKDAEGNQFTVYSGIVEGNSSGFTIHTDGSGSKTFDQEEQVTSESAFEGVPTPSSLSDVEATLCWHKTYNKTFSGVNSTAANNYDTAVKNAGFRSIYEDSTYYSNLKVRQYVKENRLLTVRHDKSSNSLFVQVSYVTFEPSLPASSFGLSGAEKTGGGRYTVKLTKQTLANYNAKVNSIAADGYTKFAQSEIGKSGSTNHVYTTTLTKGHLTQVVTYIVKSQEMYVSAYVAKNAASSHLLPDDTDYSDSVIKTSFAALNSSGNGNSFVIRLKNGHFIVFDGGYQSTAETLISYMEALATTKKPIVDAWFTTHLHIDHVEALAQIIGDFDLRNRIIVNGIYLNPTKNELSAFRDQEHGYQAQMVYGSEQLKAESGVAPEVHYLNMGQRFYFCDDVKVDVLFTDVQRTSARSVELNHTSTVYMIHIGDQTILNPGDAEASEYNSAVQLYDSTFFHTSIFLGAHHGLALSSAIATNTTKYENLDTLFIPASSRAWVESLVKKYPGLKSSLEALDAMSQKSGETLYYGNGIVFEFPYSVGESKTVTQYLSEQ